MHIIFCIIYNVNTYQDIFPNEVDELLYFQVLHFQRNINHGNLASKLKKMYHGLRIFSVCQQGQVFKGDCFMYKIYIVEDDATIARTLKEHLEKWDYQVQ